MSVSQPPQSNSNIITDFNHPLAQGIPPAWAQGWGQDQYGVFVELWLDDICQRLRWIPPGQFMMGSPDDEPARIDWEGPQHIVTINKGCWLCDTPITQALWQAVMGENPSYFKGKTLPVESVSWQDCQDFIGRINERIPSLRLSLPSEAQWEYACRALTETPFHFGGQISTDQANYNGKYSYGDGRKGEYREKTMPVKSFKPNAWGLWQMHGNIREWVQDDWHENYEAAPTDGSAWQTSDSAGRVVRGGSWGNYARSLRSAYRSSNSPGYRDFNLGFRCARVQEQDTE